MSDENEQMSFVPQQKESMNSRDELVDYAINAEQNNNDDVIMYMNKVAKLSQELTVDNRNILFKAYDNNIHRLLKSSDKDKNIHFEIIKIIEIIENHLIANSNDDSYENKAFYYNKLGEYYGYLIKDDDNKQYYIEKVSNAYELALKFATDLDPDNAIYLKLVLDASVFYYLKLDKKSYARNLASTILILASEKCKDVVTNSESEKIKESLGNFIAMCDLDSNDNGKVSDDNVK
jgi:hypothetical protein